MTETRYDYERQAWVVDGRYVRCGHPAEMDCQCYGRLHEGEPAEGEVVERETARRPKQPVKPMGCRQ